MKPQWIKKGISQPGRSDVHVDRPLTNISIGFLQDQSAFVADQVFPNVPVQSQSNKYFTLPRGEFFRDQMERRAPGARAAAINYKVSTDNYQADVWALAHDIADMVRANFDEPLDADQQAVALLGQQALIRKERSWASEFFTTSVWTGDQTGVDSASPGANQFGRWDRDDSDPIGTIRSGVRLVQGRTGYRPNKLVLGRQVYDELLDHPDIVGRVDRGQTAGTALVRKETLAALFELDSILVMDGIFNSAAEGATDSFSFIGGKQALLLYVPPAPGLMVPSAGYTFSWTGLVGGGNMGVRMLRIRMDPEHSDRLEIEMAFDQKQVSADLGLFFATAVN